MITIDANADLCTLINVFTVSPEKNDELVNILKTATEKVMCKLPGYVSANLHISDDKTIVTNYAQWKTLEDFNNVLRNEEAQVHMKQAAAIADKFEAHTYHKIWQHSL